jgi:rhodanese-related sulfurtransferase
MLNKSLLIALLSAITLSLTTIAHAQNDAAIDEIAGYLDFSEYGGGVIFAEQIPREEYKNITIIDARDPAQFAQAHIPGAINIEWRQVLNERDQIPKDKMVLIYCNTGSLSAQGGLALRVAGWDNVRILQGGFEEWQNKGGFDANTRASAPAKH